MSYMDFERANAYLELFISYEEIVKISYDKGHFDLKRVRDFLNDYGVDYARLKYVHVAGSKGKGSTCRLISNYLSKVGFKIGLYTSPHMWEVTERICCGGVDILREKFSEYVEDLKKYIDSTRLRRGQARGCKLTYFEFLTVIALKYFVDENVDYAVLEVGLGGRLDATNVVKPELSVITTVELEHVGILGDNLSEILDEKLGIVKGGVPVLIGYQSKEGMMLVKKKLKGRGRVFYAEEGNGWKEKRETAFPRPSKGGDRRVWISSFSDASIRNARVAYCALKLLLGTIDENVFHKILSEFKLPGRFDVRRIDKKIVVFDIAHTKNSALNLTNALKKNFSKKKFVFLIALMKGKDVSGILKIIGRVADEIIFTNAHKERGIPAEELKKFAWKLGLKCKLRVIEENKAAYAALLLKKNRIPVVTGSHFLVGKLLKP